MGTRGLVDLNESHGLADIRPNIGLLFVGVLFMNMLWEDAICARDKTVSQSNIYMGFSPPGGSPFRFFSLRAIAVFATLRAPALGRPNHLSTYPLGPPHG